MKKIWMTMAFCLCSLPAFAQINVQTNAHTTLPGQTPNITGQTPPAAVPAQIPRLQPTTPSIAPTTPTPGAQTATGAQTTAGAQATTNTNIPATLTGQAFVDHKNGLVKGATDRIIALQQQEKCLRAATTAAAVNACGAADTGCLAR